MSLLSLLSESVEREVRRERSNQRVTLSMTRPHTAGVVLQVSHSHTPLATLTCHLRVSPGMWRIKWKYFIKQLPTCDEEVSIKARDASQHICYFFVKYLRYCVVSIIISEVCHAMLSNTWSNSDLSTTGGWCMENFSNTTQYVGLSMVCNHGQKEIVDLIITLSAIFTRVPFLFVSLQSAPSSSFDTLYRVPTNLVTWYHISMARFHIKEDEWNLTKFICITKYQNINTFQTFHISQPQFVACPTGVLRCRVW